MKPKVLCTIRFADDLLKILSEVGIEVQRGSLTEEGLKDVDGVLIGGEAFTGRVMDAAPKLRVIGKFGVGYENVDVDAATERGIYVVYTPCVLCDTVADLTVGLMLCVARRISQADAYVRAGKWVGWEFPYGFDVSGKVLGIIGLGRIGSRVAYRAKGFNMRILYHDIVYTDAMKSLEKDLNVERVSKDQVLRASDFVTLHVPLNASTRGMIGGRELELMKPTAYLINVSRGAVVDQEALFQALKGGGIAGAGLDVFIQEPIPSGDPLLTLVNVVFTPHIGSATPETRRRMGLTVVEGIIRVLKGEKPVNIVNEVLLKNWKPGQV